MEATHDYTDIKGWTGPVKTVTMKITKEIAEFLMLGRISRQDGATYALVHGNFWMRIVIEDDEYYLTGQTGYPDTEDEMFTVTWTIDVAAANAHAAAMKARAYREDVHTTSTVYDVFKFRTGEPVYSYDFSFREVRPMPPPLQRRVNR